MATEEQKARLAEATLRLTREVLRLRDGKDEEPDKEIGRDFGRALFECPDDADDLPQLLKTLCPPEELPDIIRALDDFERVKAEPSAQAPSSAKGGNDGD
jgi:hypothetical protein